MDNYDINISKILREELALDEAYFSGNNLERHYDKHVLKPDEEFDPGDPKFPYMTLEEYKKRAEDLSKAAAGSYRKNKGNYKNKVFGWAIKNDRSSDLRYIKIRQNSPLVPGYPELVIYSEDGTIISFMLLRGLGRIYRYKSDFVSELPENEKKYNKEEE